jgi:hypothetical protein
MRLPMIGWLRLARALEEAADVAKPREFTRSYARFRADDQRAQ